MEVTALEQLIEKLSELEKKATKGPWKTIAPDHASENWFVSRIPGKESVSLVEQGIPFYICHELRKDTHSRTNAELIAASRNALPKLLSIIKVYKEALEFYATEIGGTADMSCGIAQAALERAEKLSKEK